MKDQIHRGPSLAKLVKKRQKMLRRTEALFDPDDAEVTTKSSNIRRPVLSYFRSDWNFLILYLEDRLSVSLKCVKNNMDMFDLPLSSNSAWTALYKKE